jgi:hypothetical protein
MINKFFDTIHFKEEEYQPKWINKFIRWFRVYFPDLVGYGINYIFLSAIIITIYKKLGFEYAVVICLVMMLMRVSNLSKQFKKLKL